MTDQLRAHALDLAARMLGDRRGIEVGDGPLPDDPEAVLLTEAAPDGDRLRRRAGRAVEAATVGTPVIVYVSGRSDGSAIDLERLAGEAGDVVVLEQRCVEYSLVLDAEVPSRAIEPAASRPGTPDGLLIVANLSPPGLAEARLSPGPAESGCRRELERRFAELRTRNLALARSRLGEPVEEEAVTRARVAERRLLFARVRETVSALLSRRRLRG